MEITSGAIGGDPESFDIGAGGDYLTEMDLTNEACIHLVAGVEYTLFSCDAGEYAAAYWDNGDVPYKSGQAGNTYSKSGYYLETDDQAYDRQSGEEIQMYFVNTL